MTPKPNPLHVTVTEHAQPHATQLQWWADQFSTWHELWAPQAVKELRAAADYIERLEKQCEALKALRPEIEHVMRFRLVGNREHVIEMLNEFGAVLGKVDAALRATGERER